MTKTKCWQRYIDTKQRDWPTKKWKIHGPICKSMGLEELQRSVGLFIKPDLATRGHTGGHEHR